jgi:hypothetical protein
MKREIGKLFLLALFCIYAGASFVSAQETSVVGTYKFRQTDHIREMLIDETENGEVDVVFLGWWRYETDEGEPMAHTDGARFLPARFVGNTLKVRRDRFPKCEVILTFAGDKLNVRRIGEFFDCGFGDKVVPEGVYHKSSGEKPDFEKGIDLPEEDEPKTNLETGASKAQSNAIRVRFAKGKNSAIVSGRIIKGKEVYYSVTARKGQTLEFDISENAVNNDVVAEVFGADGVNLTGEDYGKQWRGRLPRNGEYLIKVGTIESENADFRMKITIR